jgi:hypothetical protein
MLITRICFYLQQKRRNTSKENPPKRDKRTHSDVAEDSVEGIDLMSIHIPNFRASTDLLSASFSFSSKESIFLSLSLNLSYKMCKLYTEYLVKIEELDL